MDAEHLIQLYSGLDASEKRKFDERYKSLLAFRHNINAVADALLKEQRKTTRKPKRK